MEALTYSNPRMGATIENWPSGSKRVTARFEIEQTPRKGERAVRTTTGDPKKLTYAKLARIVDGSDGCTYIAHLTEFGHISIMRGDMKFSQEAIFPQDPRYAGVLELFAVDPTSSVCINWPCQLSKGHDGRCSTSENVA
ncbi:MAG: hypothetical protein WA182_14800 [Candidatus Sulfotelmatobacter sp.]